MKASFETVSERTYLSRCRVLLLTVCLGCLSMTAARAQDKPAVTVKLTAQKVAVAADGQETLGPGDKTLPGDTILYTATYRNQSEAPVRGLQATLPIPAGQEYVSGSATPGRAEACTVNGLFQRIPLKRMARGPDGQEREEPVPFSEYRKLRWTIGELKAGAATSVSARARVSAVTPPPAKP